VRFFKDPNDFNPDKVTNLDLGHASAAYPVSQKEYTYVTNITDLQVGDFVVVLVGPTPKVVLVTSVHEELAIEPNESTLYKWVVCKVDMMAYAEEMKKNRDLNKLLATSYRMNMKSQFRQAILGSVDEDTVKRISSILAGEGNG
jgi:hypothetical protein